MLLGLLLAGAARADEGEPPEDRIEPGAVPVVAYSSDQGLGLGLMGNLASFEPGYDPYRWRVQLRAIAFHSIGPSEVRWPLAAVALGVDLPGLASGWLRLHVLAYYLQHNNSAWYGLGNAAFFDQSLPESHYWYQRRRVGARARLTADLGEDREIFTLVGASWTRVDTPSDSRLAVDAADPAIAPYLVGFEPHLLLEPTLGLSLDTRDHEFWPTCGHFSEVSLRSTIVAPGGAVSGGVNFTVRGYMPVHTDRLVLAGRLIADGIVGDPPFYELSRYGGAYPDHGPGGQLAGRGYGLRRFHGKIKLLGTVEVRSRLIRFRLARMDSALGPVAFSDLGRVWADWGRRPELDGEGAGLKPSGGGGLRLHWGESFVVRVDLGFSPEGRGLYLGAGHVF